MDYPDVTGNDGFEKEGIVMPLDMFPYDNGPCFCGDEVRGRDFPDCAKDVRGKRALW